MPMFSKTVKIALAVATVSTFAGVVTVSAQDPIAERKASMKSVGGAIRPLVGFARGQADYDQAVAIASFTTMNEVAQRYGDLFPEGSETGGETKARPEIWTDRAGFDEQVANFEAVTAAAIAANPADVDAFRAVFGPVGQSCGSCHEKYQVSSN
ncbi:MAG: cytochrome c [Pseudomonadota bacterium]